MFRLIGPYLFVLTGVLIGIATTRLFNNPLRFGINILAGVLGSFFGLWLRDVFDITAGGNLMGALIAAVLGALATTILLNLTLNRR